MKSLPYSLLYSLAVLLFFKAGTTHAKKDFFITLAPTDSITGVINCQSVRVIDTRQHKDNIGYSNSGVKKLALKTKDSLSVEIKQFSQKMMQNALNSDSGELLILVHSFELTDAIRTARALSSVHIHMSSYRGSEGQYRLIVTTDTLYEMPTSKPRYLVDAANYFLTKHIYEAATVTLPKERAKASAPEEILSERMRARQQIIPYHQAPKKGIYYTFEQFRNNTPADTAVYSFHYFNDGKHYYKFFQNSLRGKNRKNLADTTCFAVSNGKIWCKKAYAKDFEEMKLVDGDFTITRLWMGFIYKTTARWPMPAWGSACWALP